MGLFSCRYCSLILRRKELHGVIIQSTRDFWDATGAKMYNCCSLDGLFGQTVAGDGIVEIFCTVF
jgi:hypothetical protein